MEHIAREGVNKVLGYKVELGSVSKNGGFLSRCIFILHS